MSGCATAKTCTQCLTSKPLDEFNRFYKGDEKRRAICRSCCLAYARARRDADPEGTRRRDRASYRRNVATSRAWHVANREQQNARSRAWYAANREWMAEYHRARYAADRDHVREINRAWDRAHREQRAEGWRRYWARRKGALIPGVEFTNAQLTARLSMFSGCWMCGGPATTVDHVKPLSKGGMHILANLRPACFSCNAAKRDRWPLSELRERRAVA